MSPSSLLHVSKVKLQKEWHINEMEQESSTKKSVIHSTDASFVVWKRITIITKLRFELKVSIKSLIQSEERELKGLFALLYFNSLFIGAHAHMCIFSSSHNQSAMLNFRFHFACKQPLSAEALLVLREFLVYAENKIQINVIETNSRCSINLLRHLCNAANMKFSMGMFRIFLWKQNAFQDKSR